MTLSLEEMERRLKNLEEEVRITRDIEEIKQLHYRYVNGIFLGKWDDLLDCFSENSVFGDPKDEQGPGPGILRGKSEIVKWLKEAGQGGHIDRVGGFVVHPLITIDGNKAKGNWLLYMLMSYNLTGQILFWIQRIYDAEYARENGEWKFSLLKMTTRLGPPGPPYEGT